MKAIAIVEIPDDAFDDEAWGDGKWMIDDEGAIRYLEDGNCWMHYKDIECDGIELRPMPPSSEENGRYVREKCFTESLSENYLDYECGWDACLDEILGEK